MHVKSPRRLTAIAAWLLAAAVPAAAHASPAPRVHAGPPEGIVFAHGNGNGHGPGGGGGKTPPPLTFHGGRVITAPAQIKAVYWGTGWGSPSFAGDKVTGLGSFYSGLGGTGYAATNTEYTDSGGTHVSSGVSYAGAATDATSAGRKAPSTSSVLASVARAVPNPVAHAYYPVYSDIPRGHAGYCAWHSVGTINGTEVQFGFFFALDGDSGCDPSDGSGQHSQGLAALANVSGHEYSEMVTDPALDAWYDSSGAENADKCAWQFGASLLTFSNGSRWKIQGNWSNAAKGCIYGA